MMIETSESTAKLDAALAKAQGDFQAAIKDSNNPAFKAKYADLSAVMEAIRPALIKHGINVTQWPVHSEDDRVHMVTRIAHDGEWMRGIFSMPVMKKDAHGYGSIVTYLRRYCIASCFGVIADLDDDGNAAAGRTEQAVPAEVQQKYDHNPIVRRECDRITRGIRQIEQQGSIEDLQIFWDANQQNIADLPAPYRKEVQAAKDEAKTALSQKVAA